MRPTGVGQQRDETRKTEWCLWIWIWIWSGKYGYGYGGYGYAAYETSNVYSYYVGEEDDNNELDRTNTQSQQAHQSKLGTTSTIDKHLTLHEQWRMWCFARWLIADARSRYFQVDWVLIDELAIGPAPRKKQHLDRLHELGVKGILSLCSTTEAEPPEKIEQSFQTRRIVLPEPRAGPMPSTHELKSAVENLRELLNNGPVFVHCVAAMERSPLVCLGWLVKVHRMNPDRALDYLMQQHPGTNPLPGQLKLLQGCAMRTTHRSVTESL